MWKAAIDSVVLIQTEENLEQPQEDTRPSGKDLKSRTLEYKTVVLTNHRSVIPFYSYSASIIHTFNLTLYSSFKWSSDVDIILFRIKIQVSEVTGCPLCK